MDTLEQRAAATADMIRIPGGTFRMGSDRHYPEEAPVHSVTVDGFWIDPTPVTNAQFRAFVQGDGPRHLGRDPARSQGLSRRSAAHAEGGRPRLHAARQAGRSRATGVSGGASPSAPPGGGPTARAATSAGSTITRWCRSPIATPRPTPNGPARNCRRKPSGNSPRAAGSTARSSPGAMNSRPAASTWPTPGRARFPLENLRTDGWARTSPVRAFPPNGYGVHDMIGNVWEWTTDWYSARHEGRCRQGLLRAGESARRRDGSELRSAPARHPHPAQGAERRLASLRAQLLPALSSGGAPCRAGRYLDQSCRLSVHRQENAAR